MRHFAFAVPGDLATPTGGYAYDRRIVNELRAAGWRIDISDLGGSFPRPDAAAVAKARSILGAIDSTVPVVIDGLALGVLPDVAAALSSGQRLIALVHHPLALESGIPRDEALRLRASERKALEHVRHVIVTSPATARLLSADYGVPDGMITVVRPGSDPVPPARGSTDDTTQLLAIGSIVPRKGYDVLVAALAMLPDLPWRLTIVGDASRDPACARSVAQEIGRHGLGERIRMTGAVAEEKLASFYDCADLFVLASHFEGYGMAFADALARGIPVVACRAGAIPDTVPSAAGILVPPGDARALSAALRGLIADPSARKTLRQGALNAAKALPDWKASAQLFARAIEAVS